MKIVLYPRDQIVIQENSSRKMAFIKADLPVLDRRWCLLVVLLGWCCQCNFLYIYFRRSGFLSITDYFFFLGLIKIPDN